MVTTTFTAINLIIQSQADTVLWNLNLQALHPLDVYETICIKQYLIVIVR